MTGGASRSDELRCSRARGVETDGKTRAAVRIRQEAIAGHAVGEERSSVLAFQCLQPGKADQARALIMRVEVRPCRRRPLWALLDIDRVRMGGLHCTACHYEYRKADRENETTHRVTLLGDSM